MEISALQAFVKVAESGSFSRAAEQLHLTQPAISKRVASLEAELGAPLFDRIGRRILPTEAGQQLLPRARRLLLEVADMRRTVSNLTEGVAGTLAMGTSHHIGLRRLPPVLRAFSGRHPEVRLDLHFMDSESASAAVERGELEMAVVTLPPRPSKNLTLRPVWNDPLCFVAAGDHPLATLPAPTLAGLARFPAVLAARGTYTREIMEEALLPLGLKVQIGMETNYLETLKMMAAIGLGWSLLPETMSGEGGLRVLPIREISLRRQLGIVTHRGRTLSNAALAMVASCEAHADPPSGAPQPGSGSALTT